MSKPQDIPSGENSWKESRIDATLGILWSSRGLPVCLGPIARNLDLDADAAAAWMQNNGHGLWESAEKWGSTWRPLIRKNKNAPDHA